MSHKRNTQIADRFKQILPEPGDRAPRGHEWKLRKRSDRSATPSPTDHRPAIRAASPSAPSDLESGLLVLQTVEAAKANQKGEEHLTVRKSSPWKSYHKKYELQTSGFVTVAVQRDPSRRMVVIKTFDRSTSGEKLRTLWSLKHECFNPLLDVFNFENTIYVVFDHVPVSLSQVTGCPAYPNEEELAAILGQGLAYLHRHGYQHGSLKCTNILITRGGRVKLENQELCCNAGNYVEDIRALAKITMQIMQKYVSEDGAVGIDDLDRWPYDSRAVGFLSTMTGAASVDELMQHALIQCPWNEKDLMWSVELAAVSVHRNYRYEQ